MVAGGGLPGTFLRRLELIVGADEAAGVVASMAQPKDVAFWRNPLVAASAADAEVPRAAEPLGFASMYRVPARDRNQLTRSPAAVSGSVFIQNPASVYAALALEAQPGEEVLDLCAAPGGKSLVIAAAMNNSGRLAVVESVPARFHRLRANLTRCGVAIAAAYLKDGRRVGRATPGRFDRVLIDAPCSSESRFRVDEPASYAHWKLRKVKESARKQRALLRSGYAALKPGGRLIYCTCTFAPEENEGVIDEFLRVEPTAEVLELADPPCRWQPGVASWRDRAFDPQLGKARRLLPDAVWDGFFVCALGKR